MSEKYWSHTHVVLYRCIKLLIIDIIYVYLTELRSFTCNRENIETTTLASARDYGNEENKIIRCF